MKRFGYMVAGGSFLGMLVALAMDRTEVMLCHGFLMVAGSVLSLHQARTDGNSAK